MKKILVIQNEAEEGLGLLENELKQAEISFDIIHPYRGDAVPAGLEFEEKGYRALMILGGPMHADDEAHFPFIADEISLIQACLRNKVPMLNICLGAQLLAKACGMRLHLRGTKEVGWHPVILNDWYTQRNPLFFQLPAEFMTFHWHQDSFEVPTDAYVLARSELYANQAFCVNGNAYGIQFHPEITEEMIQAWIEKDRKRAVRFLSASAEKEMLEKMAEYLPQQKKIAHKLIYGFETAIRPEGHRRPTPPPPEATESAPEKTEEATASEGA